MDLKKESLLMKIWNVLWPLLIYLLAQSGFAIAGGSILIAVFGIEAYNKYSIIFVLMAALFCIPIYYKMYKRDKEENGEEKKNIPMENKDYLAIILSGAALALMMNNLISVTPLPFIFTGYEETNEVLFGGGILLQILSAGIFGCIVEEFSMRGVTYLRMKRYWGKKKAIVFSAVVFGLYHMNVVQAVYAFFLGLFFAWIYERYDTLWAPCIAHMSANLFVILLSGSKVIEHILTSMVGFSLITCISMLVFYYSWRYIKQTDPVVELQFVEKEPDTLQKLTKEYKEQEREEEKS